MGSQDTLVIAPSNGVFSSPHFNGVLAQDQPPITTNFSGMVYFQASVICPRPLSLLMCLTIFTWMPWNARLLVGAFFQKLEKVHK